MLAQQQQQLQQQHDGGNNNNNGGYNIEDFYYYYYYYVATTTTTWVLFLRDLLLLLPTRAVVHCTTTRVRKKYSGYTVRQSVDQRLHNTRTIASTTDTVRVVGSRGVGVGRRRPNIANPNVRITLPSVNQWKSEET